MEKFSREFQGYNRKEVDDFLDDTIKRVEMVLEKIKKQETEIGLLRKELEHYKDIEKSLNKVLANVESTSNNIKRMAQYEADLIVQEAKGNANRIVNESLMRAEKIEAERNRAEKNLKTFKNRLRMIVEQQLDVVDEIEQLEIE